VDDAVKPTVIALVGPTASGKTDLALYLAEHLGGEIIACDSRTIYRHMDIGTAKPSKEEQAKIPHHLLDVVNPDESYTVSQFVQAARHAIDQCHINNHLPIVCGGTGFYARALLEGLVLPDVPPQAELRQSLQLIAEQEGNAVLHQKLRSIDPESANRINENDLFRIIRALEVSQVLGRPFSQAVQRTEPPYRTIWLGLSTQDRSVLYSRIKKRFQLMLAAGLEQEVKALLDRWGHCQTLLKTVNYQELVPLLEGQDNPDNAYSNAVRHNCNLAQRQLIWFRANPEINWFFSDQQQGNQLQVEALRLVKTRL